jgi:hypothetical protein
MRGFWPVLAASRAMVVVNSPHFSIKLLWLLRNTSQGASTSSGVVSAVTLTPGTN